MELFLDKQPFELNLILKCCNLQDLVKTAITNAAVEENQPETREGKNAIIVNCLSVVTLTPMTMLKSDLKEDDITYMSQFLSSLELARI